MAIPHAQQGDVIDVRPWGPALATAKTTTLLKSQGVEVIRLALPAGKELAEHKAPGPITIQCLEGKVRFTALNQTSELTSGQMLFLTNGVPHSVHCLEDASLLLTIVLPQS